MNVGVVVIPKTIQPRAAPRSQRKPTEYAMQLIVTLIKKNSCLDIWRQMKLEHTHWESWESSYEVPIMASACLMLLMVACAICQMHILSQASQEETKMCSH